MLLPVSGSTTDMVKCFGQIGSAYWWQHWAGCSKGCFQIDCIGTVWVNNAGTELCWAPPPSEVAALGIRLGGCGAWGTLGGCYTVVTVGGAGTTSLLDSTAIWGRADIWELPNLAKGAAGDGFVRSAVRSCAAAMAVLADNSAGIWILCRNNSMVSSMH